MSETNEPVNPDSSPDAEPDTTESAAAAETGERTDGGGPGTLDVIMDLDLPLTVRFGQTQMTLGALSRLGPGSEISLDRSNIGAAQGMAGLESQLFDA